MAARSRRSPAAGSIGASERRPGRRRRLHDHGSVTGLTGGLKTNTTSAVTSTEGGTGGIRRGVPRGRRAAGCGAADDRQGVRGSDIAVNGTTTLTFTLTNPNPGTRAERRGLYRHAARGPRGGNTERPDEHVRGGTTTAVAGAGSVALANGGLPASGSCTITVNVTTTTAGVKTNTTSAVTSTEGGRAGPPRRASRCAATGWRRRRSPRPSGRRASS